MILLVILAAAVLLPGTSRAFNNERQGFILGLGGGYGSAKWSSHGDSESWSGVATTLRLGGGVNNQTLVYYSNRVVFFSIEGYNFYQGMSAAGVSYFLEPTGPSFFFSGELGMGVIGTWEEGGDSESGFGFTLGAGYEVSPHLLLEFNYMRASVGDSSFDWDISNITFTVSWLGY
jgi:hypothetical protein